MVFVLFARATLISIDFRALNGSTRWWLNRSSLDYTTIRPGRLYDIDTSSSGFQCLTHHVTLDAVTICVNDHDELPSRRIEPLHERNTITARAHHGHELRSEDRMIQPSAGKSEARHDVLAFQIRQFFHDLIGGQS